MVDVTPGGRKRAAKMVSDAKAQFDVILDGVVNEMTGAGTAKSKVAAAKFRCGYVLTKADVEALYRHSALAKRLVEKPVDDALKQGFVLKRAGKDGRATDNRNAKRIQKRVKELRRDRLGQDKLKQGLINARAYGGGGLLIGALGSGLMTQLLEPSRVTKVDYVRPFHRHQLMVKSLDSFNEPAMYTISWGEGVEPFDVHPSRLLFFPGGRTLEIHRRSNSTFGGGSGWDDSILQAGFETLISFLSAYSSVDGMFSDVSQSVFRLNGLIEALAGAGSTEQAQLMTDRLSLMNLTRSVFNAVFLDAGGERGKGGEEFQVVERSTLAGLDGIINLYWTRLASDYGWPLTILCGSAPNGMDATGDNDLLLYLNGVVADVRKIEIEPNLMVLIECLHSELRIKSSVEDWEIEWPSAFEPKPLDVATLEQMRVRTACELASANVVTPAQVGLSLASLAPTLGLQIDREALSAMSAEQMKALLKRATMPPEAPNGTANGAQGRKDTGRNLPARTAGQQT